MKKKEKDIKENIEKFEQVIKARKKLPHEEKKKLAIKILVNIIMLLLILAGLFGLNIGEENIQTETYIKILQGLSLGFVGITVIMFEISYKCNKNNIILHSIEVMFVTFFVLMLIPAYSLYYGSFYKVIRVEMIIFTMYYILKCIVMIRNSKKNYYKSFNDIKTIVAKR